MIQLREKDLSARALEELAVKAMAAVVGSRTRLLINARTDVALACGAHGVHLPANDLAASDVRAVFARAGVSEAVIGVSTHSAAEVASAEAHGADFAVFAPVFEKGGTGSKDGVEELRRICHRAEAAQPPMPVLALGGVTVENAQLCVAAGAAGIAAIRLFQQNDVLAVVKKLREAFSAANPSGDSSAARLNKGLFHTARNWSLCEGVPRNCLCASSFCHIVM